MGDGIDGFSVRARVILKYFRSSTPCKGKKEMEEFGYEEFLLRLWVIPHSDPKLAQLTLVALPIPDVNNAVDSHHVKGGGGYPSLLVDDGTFATVGPRVSIPGGPFGCPCVPVVIDCSEDTTEVNTAELITMMRCLWGRMNVPYLVAPQDWATKTAESPVEQQRQPAAHRWPALVPGGEMDPQGRNLSC